MALLDDIKKIRSILSNQDVRRFVGNRAVSGVKDVLSKRKLEEDKKREERRLLMEKSNKRGEAVAASIKPFLEMQATRGKLPPKVQKFAEEPFKIQTREGIRNPFSLRNPSANKVSRFMAESAVNIGKTAVFGDVETNREIDKAALKAYKGQDITPAEEELIGEGAFASSLILGFGTTGDLSKLGRFRKFSDRVSKNVESHVSRSIKNAPDSFYSPQSNKKLIKETSKVVGDAVSSKLKQGVRTSVEQETLNLALSGKGKHANTAAMELLTDYIGKGQFEEALSLVKQVSPRFTEEGRAIQILSAYGRLTPEGALRFAQKSVDEASAGLVEKLELSPQAAEEITGIASKLQKMKEGRGKVLETAKLMDKIAEQVPTSLGQKISTLQTMSHLLNPKTAIRNIGGNTAFAGVENVSDVVAANIDRAISVVTGKRTKSLPNIKAQMKGMKEGWNLGLQDALLGVDTSGMGTRFDLPKKTFRDPVFGRLEKLLNVELRATDRAAYQAAFAGSLDDQMRAAGVREATEEMLEIAHKDGQFRTFQDNSVMAQIFQGIKTVFNKVGIDGGKFGLGDLVLKYPKTPGNLLSRGFVDYSPAGFLKSMSILAEPLVGKPFNQRAFSESLARASVGTGGIGMAGYILAEAGVVTGQGQGDFDKITETERAVGAGPFKFNVSAFKRFIGSGFQKQKTKDGDLLVTYDWLQPVALPFTMGVDFALGSKNSDIINNIMESVSSAESGLTDQPSISNLLKFTQDIKNKGFLGASGGQVLKGVSGFIPTFSKQVAQTLDDNVARSSYDPNLLEKTKRQVQARIPGARSQLPAYVNVLGEDQPGFGTGATPFNVFFNPSFSSRFQERPATQEVMRIFEATGEKEQAFSKAPFRLKVNGVDTTLNQDQRNEYLRFTGPATETAFEDFLMNDAFNTLPDETKAKLMGKTISSIKDAAKISALGHSPDKTPNATKAVLDGKVKGLALANLLQSSMEDIDEKDDAAEVEAMMQILIVTSDDKTINDAIQILSDKRVLSKKERSLLESSMKEGKR